MAKVRERCKSRCRSQPTASTQKSVADFHKWWSSYMQLLRNYDLLSSRPGSFNSGLRYNRTPESSLEKVETHEIELYLAFRIQKSPTIKKGGRFHRSSVRRFYKILQFVYQLDTKRQLTRTKATNDEINKVNLCCGSCPGVATD